MHLFLSPWSSRSFCQSEMPADIGIISLLSFQWRVAGNDSVSVACYAVCHWLKFARLLKSQFDNFVKEDIWNILCLLYLHYSKIKLSFLGILIVNKFLTAIHLNGLEIINVWPIKKGLINSSRQSLWGCQHGSACSRILSVK